MIYEERRVLVRRGLAMEYQRLSRESIWPALSDHGAHVLCLLGGLIGDPPDELLQITRFPDLSAWERAQQNSVAHHRPLIEREEVRLLRAVSSRPKAELSPADRRQVYGYRRFLIQPSDLDEFVHCSAEGVWPRIEAQGAHILGLWTTRAATTPMEVVLLTGYHDPTHWDETRATRPKPNHLDQQLWDESARLLARRSHLTLKTWVCLMRALELP
ncbi:MAG: hypothetical protein HY259_08880 [Chloroflexi bacterium]|nr:hypothetical protein [Chloroflexota bacterium]